MTLHDDDAAMIRRFAIKQARACVAGGDVNIRAGQAWIGVAVIAGADKGDLAASLGLTEAAIDEGVDLVREDRG